MNRKISREAAYKFEENPLIAGEKKLSRNTTISVPFTQWVELQGMGDDSDTYCMIELHDNPIAVRSVHHFKYFWISDGGYQSSTTKDRLNALPNVHVVQRDYQWYLNGKKWDGEWTEISVIPEPSAEDIHKELSSMKEEL